MEKFFLCRSQTDAEFCEVISRDAVVEEIHVPWKIRKIPSSFASLAEIHQWLARVQLQFARSYALFLVSRWSYAKHALEKKLILKKFSGPVCQKIVDEMEQLGYVSDDAIIEQMICKKIKAGYGPLYIEQYLCAKGLNSTKVKERMTEEMQRQSIEMWLEKMKGKDRAKICAFLVRRGFEGRLIPWK